jgi:hypothetical protein
MSTKYTNIKIIISANIYKAKQSVIEWTIMLITNYLDHLASVKLSNEQ